MQVRSAVRTALAVGLLLSAGAASGQALPGRLGRWLGTTAVPNGLGVNIHFTAGHVQDLQHIRDFGFRMVRTDLLWAEVERDRGVYDWSQYDELVSGLRTAGLRAMLILAYSNPLYSPRTGAEGPSRSVAAPKEGEARSAFMRFARAAAERFGAGVVWEVWNEPNLTFGSPVDLNAYVGFAVEACQVVHQAAPDAPVIGPAASGFAWDLFRRLLSADKVGCFDAISVHPYRDWAPDDVVKDWAALSELVCTARPACPALVSSEWGYSAWSGQWTAERQADYIPRTYLLDMLAHVPITIVYDWRDDGPEPGDKEANFGLLTYGGQPKPVYRTLRTLVQALDGLSVIGRVASAGPRSVVIAFGQNSRPSKLAGWSEAGDRTVLLPEGACVSPNPGRSELVAARYECPAEAMVMPAPVAMQLTSRPTVADVPLTATGRMGMRQP